ncbi:hypothetical protein [Chitinimonas sp. JJ19]|uniref:hypothetical protein n=1 Tax=Chitinimonas sp. JJ19 TaxID=3109352 RepID=UPI0030029459
MNTCHKLLITAALIGLSSQSIANERASISKTIVLAKHIIATKTFSGKPAYGIPYVKVYSTKSELIYASDFIRSMVENDELFKGKHETRHITTSLMQDLDQLKLKPRSATYTVLYFKGSRCPPCDELQPMMVSYLDKQLGKDYRFIIVDVDHRN